MSVPGTPPMKVRVLVLSPNGGPNMRSSGTATRCGKQSVTRHSESMRTRLLSWSAFTSLIDSTSLTNPAQEPRDGGTGPRGLAGSASQLLSRAELIESLQCLGHAGEPRMTVVHRLSDTL